MVLSKVINVGKNPAKLQPKRILCIKQDEIGDVVNTLHVYSMLHAEYPYAEITVVCKPFAVSLFLDNPAVAHVETDLTEVQGRFDLIVELRGSWQSIFFAITHWPTLRFDRATVRFRNSRAGKQPHEVITNLQIVQPIISPKHQHTAPKMVPSIAAQDTVTEYLRRNSIDSFILLHIGASKELKKWGGFAALVRYLKQQYQMEIIFIGSSGDISDIENIQAQVPFATYSVAGVFNLTELAALTRKASVYIGNDSGPLHIAAINGAPSLGLFGPCEPDVFYPYGPKTAVLHHVLECNPCDQIHCVVPDNPCINRITLNEVIQKTEELLQNRVV